MSWLINTAQYILGMPQNTDIIQIEHGIFKQLDPNPDTVFEDSTLSIRKAGREYHYHLVISCNNREEEQELDDEKSFLIAKELNFHKLMGSNNQVLFRWTDSDGINYEFRVNAQQVTRNSIDKFEKILLESVYEFTFKKSREFATLNDLEELKYSPESSPNANNNQNSPSDANFPKGKELFTCPCELYSYDLTSANFIPVSSDARVFIVKVSEFGFFLTICIEDRVVISQPMDADFNSQFNDQFYAFIWVYRDNQKYQTWAIKFKNKEFERSFLENFTCCSYEVRHQSSFEKLDESSRNFLINSYDDDVIMEDAEKSSDEEYDEKESRPRQKSSDPFSNDKNTNSQLAVGFSKQRSFVVRGDRIGVFKNDDDDVQYDTSIDKIRTPNGKNFSPAKVMLRDQDSKMVLFDSNNANNLYQLDVEYGKIVDEWKIDDDREVKDFTHDTKYGQMTPERTFVGISKNALFRIDPRQPDNKLVPDQLKQYKTNNKFSCTVTTGKGDLIVASEKGELRLYDKIDKQAKTSLPGFGDPIIGIDVTEDGKYILATCKTYLLVYQTFGSEDKSLDGFKKSLGRQKKPPKRLQLRPEHVSWINEPISFTPAKFNTGEDMEKTIVCSTGEYVIKWNFRRVKSGYLKDYTINKYPHKVVADSFRYGSDKKVIVTLPNDVTMSAKKSFSTPEKLFMSGKGSSSKSSVVNSPY